MTSSQHLNNFIPMRELSETVMQIEKNIYFLNRWSVDGEEYLTEKYKEQLAPGFKINITNPSGIIVMGRGNNLTSEQRRDFEVVKRKYKNIADIINYDDLLERLSSTIRQMEHGH